MSLFHRNFAKLEDEAVKKEQMELDLQKLRNENLGKSDIIAIFAAMFQLLLPYAIGIVIIYFLVIQFITKVWFK